MLTPSFICVWLCVCVGLECVSLLAFRNYAEKVINLGELSALYTTTVVYY